MKLNSFGMNSHPKRYENTLIKSMKLHPKGMKWCRRYEKIPMIPRYETDAQGMKDSTRYEKCAQGMKMCSRYKTNAHRYEIFCKVWNTCFLEKQWFFIPLWVCFIPFWVWKKSLFFPDVNTQHTQAHGCPERWGCKQFASGRRPEG
jgi:hypothetical protein